MAARREDHRDYDRLAVDHVLGELDAVDQARFRDHLVGCEDCRARVNELRGIAADMQAAVKAESARVLTRMPPRAPRLTGEPGRRRWPRLLAASVVGLVIGALAFWNLQLRLVNSVLDTATQTNRQALATLVEGDLLTADFAEGVRGLVAADDEFVAFDLTGMPSLQADEFVVLWSTDDEGARAALIIVSATSLDDDRLVLVSRLEDAVASLTVEVGPFDGQPRREVVVVRLDE